jgi:LPXTG-site transpeptidase (sortase) family protein
MRVADVVGLLRRSPQAALPLAGVSIAAACGLLVWLTAFAGGSGSDAYQSLAPIPLAPSPTPASPVERLIIPAIQVDAPVMTKIVSSDRRMPDPEDPRSVIWYDFSAIPGLGGRPGGGGNSVLAGHFEYHDFGPAVFWNLGNLRQGDEIDLRLQDGTEYRYAARSNDVVDATSASWDDIVASTSEESVTLITCAGTFDPLTQTYNQRRIVWATRIG